MGRKKNKSKVVSTDSTVKSDEQAVQNTTKNEIADISNSDSAEKEGTGTQSAGGANDVASKKKRDRRSKNSKLKKKASMKNRDADDVTSTEGNTELNETPEAAAHEEESHDNPSTPPIEVNLDEDNDDDYETAGRDPVIEDGEAEDDADEKVYLLSGAKIHRKSCSFCLTRIVGICIYCL
jgi:hypothetical protein